MTLFDARPFVIALAALLVPTAAARSQETKGDNHSAARAADAPSTDAVVTVNGHPITRDEIEALFVTIARDRYRGKSFTADELDALRKQHWSDVIRANVNNWLVDNEIKDIVVSDSEVADVMNTELSFFLANSRKTRSEFNAQLMEKSGVTLYELLADRKASPYYRDAVRRDRWIAAHFPDKIEVTDEEVKEVFERRWTERTLPARVRISHILIARNDSDSDQSKEQARKNAESVLAEAKAPGADFAALARKHSACPSASKGGDLGFIHRYGDAQDAVAEAAFALKIGEISGVVDAPDGFHIIKVTERIEPRPATLPLVDDVIRTSLRKRKIKRAMREQIEKLRSTATIVYAESPPSE